MMDVHLERRGLHGPGCWFDGVCLDQLHQLCFRDDRHAKARAVLNRPAVARYADEVVQVVGLIFEEACAVEMASEVPVGGVEEAHRQSFRVQVLVISRLAASSAALT